MIWIIGGSATPTAWNTAPPQPGAAARRRSLLPAWSTSVLNDLIEIADDIGPFEPATGGDKTVDQFFAQQQSKE
jgi:hypothetical protein